jgi:hypothetical protein
VEEDGLGEALARSGVLWITSRHATVDGARGREYEIFTSDGRALLAARSTVWGREIVVTHTPGGALALRLLRSRAFILNGRADVLAARGSALGAVYRSGRFRDRSGRTIGRFRDARTFRSWGGEALLQSVLDNALGAGGSDSQLSAPTAFVCAGDAGLVASLARKRLPFNAPEPGTPSDRVRAVVRLLPRGLARRLLDPGASHGWALEWAAPVHAEPLLLLGAALFTIELSHW